MKIKSSTISLRQVMAVRLCPTLFLNQVKAAGIQKITVSFTTQYDLERLITRGNTGLPAKASEPSSFWIGCKTGIGLDLAQGGSLNGEKKTSKNLWLRTAGTQTLPKGRNRKGFPDNKREARFVKILQPHEKKFHSAPMLTLGPPGN